MHEIFIYDQIGSDWFSEGVTAAPIAKALKSHAGEDVLVRVNSPGGDVFEGMAIYNALKQHDGKVTVQVDGLAASAASVIAMAGDEVLMGEGTFIMIHEAWGLAMGSVTDILAYAELLEKVDGQILSVYQGRTGLEADTLKEMVQAETWLTADEAIAQGFADGMAKTPEKSGKKAKNKAFSMLNKFKNVPAALLEPEEETPPAPVDETWKLALKQRELQLLEVS